MTLDLAGVVLILAALVMAYRLVVLSELANWVRDRWRVVWARRQRLPRWKRRLVWLAAFGACRDCHQHVSYRWRADHRSLEVDHVHPWSAGGSDSIWNLRATCRPCNSRKGAKVEVRR